MLEKRALKGEKVIVVDVQKRAVEAWTLKDEVKGDGFRKNTNVSNLKKS